MKISHKNRKIGYTYGSTIMPLKVKKQTYMIINYNLDIKYYYKTLYCVLFLIKYTRS